MKKVIFLLFISLTVFSCIKDKNPTPRGTGSLVKKIKVADYKLKDTVTFNINYNGNGLVEAIDFTYSSIIPGELKPNSLLVTYEEEKIKKTVRKGSGTYANGAFGTSTIITDYEYNSAGKLQSITKRHSERGAERENLYSTSFYYNEQSGLSSISYSYEFKSFNFEPGVEFEGGNFTLAPSTGPNSLTFISKGSELESCPGQKFVFNKNNNFEYNYSKQCEEINHSFGTYSRIKIKVRKPVWDELVFFIPGLDPVKGSYLFNLSRPAFYLPDLVPEFYPQTISDGYTNTTYEYVTDDKGKLLSIKELENGEIAKLIRFMY